MSDAGTAYVKVKPDFSAMNAELARKLTPMANQFGSRFGKALGPVMAQQSKHLRTFTTAAKYGTAGAAGLAAVVGKDLIAAGAKFEKQMSVNAAVSEANRKQLARLEQQSIKLGQATFYSASEAAEAQGELIKGGLKVKQVLGGGLPAALHLAEAGQLDLATAAETTVNAMKLFSLRGKDANSVADMLATAANRTTADVLDFAMAMKQGGSVSKLAGYNMNETVTVLEALAEAGIKNSDAGTSMKTSIIHLLNPQTKQRELMKELNLHFISQEGHLKSAAGISKELRRATDDMTKAERAKALAVLAGTDGVRTLNALYSETPKELRELEQANAKQGTAQVIAAKKMNNLSGEWEQFKGSLETTEIQIYKGMAPALKDLTGEATKAANRIGDVFANENLDGSEKLQKAAQVLGNEIGAMWDRYHVEDHLIEGLDKFLNDAVPRIAEHAGELGVKFAEGFADGFTHADLLGKVVMGSWLLHFIGGKAPFIAVGKSMGKQFGMGFADQAAASTAAARVTTAAGSAGAVAGAGWLGTEGRRAQIRLRESGMRTIAQQTAAEALAAQGGLFSTVGRDIERRWKGLGTRLARGVTTWGLGGLIVGEISKEIVGGDAGAKLNSALQGAGFGAALGSVGGPIGTAIGGALGGAGGLLAEELGKGDELGSQFAEDFGRAFERKLPHLRKAVDRMDFGTPGRSVQQKISAAGVDLVLPGRVGGSGLRGARAELREQLAVLKDTGASAEAIAALQQRLALVDAALHKGAKAVASYNHGFDLLKSGAVTRLGDIAKVSQEDITKINQVWKNNPPKWHQAMAQSMKASIAAVRSGMKQNVIETEVGQRRIKELTRNLRLFEGRDPLGLAKTFADGWDQAGKVNSRQIQAEIGELKKMPKGAQEAAREAMIRMAQKMESEGKLVKGSASRLTSALTTKFGQTNKQIQQSTAQAMAHIAKSAAEGATNVGGALSNVFDNLSNALAAVGASNVPPFSFSLSALATAGQYHDTREATQSGFGHPPRQHKQDGGSVHPQGFTVPGQGDGDRYKTWGEVNAFVMNREATRTYGFQDGGAVPLALEAGERYFTRKEVQQFGRRNLEFLNESVPRFGFQKGGPLSEPHLSGPEPLRSLGQAAIHQVNEAAKRYLQQHTPHGGPGYSGPPIGPAGTSPYKGILMATWVRQALEWAAKKGVEAQPSSGYRSHAQNVSEGRNYFSEHEKTQYPGGAVDFGGYVDPAAKRVKDAVVAATQDFKYPLLAPIGFRDDGHASGTGHQLGGLVRALQALASGGAVVKVAGSVLDRHGLDLLASAGIMGNSWQESGWDSEAMEPGTDNGGLFGFTAGEKSMAALRSFAERQGASWDDTQTQVQFMLSSFPWSMRDAINGMGSVDDTTRYFMDNWERPNASLANLPRRIEGAKKALPLLEGVQGASSDEHTFKEDIPATYAGAKTGSIDFPSVPNNLQGVAREIKRWAKEARVYRKAQKGAEKANRPGVANAIGQNITEIENHLRQLYAARHKQRVEKAKKAFTKALSKKVSKAAGYETTIAGLKRGFDTANQTAEQIVELEPQAPELPASATDAQREAAEKGYVQTFTDYINQRERPAYEGLLGQAAEWRNAILRAETFGFGKDKPSVRKMAATTEKKVWEIAAETAAINQYTEKVGFDLSAFHTQHPKAKALPNWLKNEITERDRKRSKLPYLRFEDQELRKTIGELRESFYPGGDENVRIKPPALPLPGSGTLEGLLEEVQGIHWPDQHSLLPASKLVPPRVAGQFGGVVWELQGSIEELGLKISQASNGLGGGESGSPGGEGENEALLREVLMQKNQEGLVRQIEERVLGGRNQFPPYAGKAHTGAIVPGPPTQERTMIVRGNEGIFTEDQRDWLLQGIPAAPTAAGAPHVQVTIYESGEVSVKVDEKEVEAIIDRKQRHEARRAGTRRAGRRP